MTSAPLDDEPPPEDPRLRPIRRLVTLLLAVLVLGSTTVVAALVLMISDLRGGTEPTVVGVRAGERLVGAELGDGRIVLMLEGSDGGARALAFDAETLSPLGTITIEAAE